MANEVRFKTEDTKDKNGNRHFAEPGIIHVKQGDEVTFYYENSDFTVFIPHSDLLFEGKSKNLIFEVTQGIKQKKLVVSKSANKGEYPYAVYCENGSDFAVGKSSPKIIVD